MSELEYWGRKNDSRHSVEANQPLPGFFVQGYQAKKRDVAEHIRIPEPGTKGAAPASRSDFRFTNLGDF